jgi:multidrug efflux pump subunit AcrA (membrane-fusion protein)
MARPLTPQKPKGSQNGLFGEPGVDLSVDESSKPASPAQRKASVLPEISMNIEEPDPFAHTSRSSVGGGGALMKVKQKARALWNSARGRIDPMTRPLRLQLARLRIRHPLGFAFIDKYRLFILGGLAAVVVAGVVGVSISGGEKSPAELKAIAARTTKIKAGADGTVIEMKVDQNERVDKDELLMVINPEKKKKDPPELAPMQKKLAAAQAHLKRVKSPAELKQATADVAKRKAELVGAEKNVTALKAKLKKKKATAKQVAEAEKKVEVAEANVTKATEKLQVLSNPDAVEEAEAALKTAQAEMDEARAKFGMIEVRSPVKGTVATVDPEKLVGTKVRGRDEVLAVVADE